MFRLNITPTEKTVWNTITPQQKQTIALLVQKYSEVSVGLTFEEILDLSDDMVGCFLNSDEFAIWHSLNHEQLHMMVILFNRIVATNFDRLQSYYEGANEDNEDWSGMGFGFDEIVYQCLLKKMDGEFEFRFLTLNNN